MSPFKARNPDALSTLVITDLYGDGRSPEIDLQRDSRRTLASSDGINFVQVKDENMSRII